MRRYAPPFVLALCVWITCAPIKEDELRCEEAIARLSDCCPGLQVRGLACVTEDADGCNNEPAIKPAIPERAAVCILAKSCPDLQAAKTCEAAQAYAERPYQLREPNMQITGLCQ